RREATASGRAPSRGAEPAPEAAPQMVAVTIASLPRTPEATLERDAVQGFLQYGHRIDQDALRAALSQTFRHPALDAVRAAIAATPDHARAGWAVAAVETVREPYRTLAAELLTSAFPAASDDAAVIATADLAQRIRLRGVDREKRELLGALQRVAPDSDEGRAVRVRMRELDALRQQLTGEA
ncbi:MAG: DNA primase, partial [Microbacterium sp.]